MLFKLIYRLFRRRRSVSGKAEYRIATLERANGLMNNGDLIGAATVFREYLQSEPHDLDALNNLGFCLVSMGDTAGASLVFEQVALLDDTYVLGLTNRAKVLNDQRRSAEALSLLHQAKICDPGSPNIDAVYANACLSLGESSEAKVFALRAWLGNFDDLRSANCYLVDSAYGDFNETQLAAEHRFWADTVRPIKLIEAPEGGGVRRTSADLIAFADETVSEKPTQPGKVRIGYWSPDFRNHSVRYFFRPLLEGHDFEKFEIFLYHDFPTDDEQTAAIAEVCTQFHDICEFSDSELHALITSHQLDILVELTGHMSHNRAALLQHRFATLQLTGLGYPPTTGLRSVDAKILDKYTYTTEAKSHYAEYPLVLPSSFWCFDPKEEVALPSAPPVEKNGYVTFGCSGNLAKITEKILGCWGAILFQVPGSRLIIRSLTLLDTAAEEATWRRLRESGLPLDRVDLRRPEGGAAFFASYNEIDIILDTFPFNGGTTTCFATYMGVAVVTWYGNSLISRMGLSVMSNLGAPQLAVSNANDYIKRAVAVAADVPFLQQFRRDARARYQQSSLGNGKLFATEFEEACMALLEKKSAGALNYNPEIPLLEANEMVRRVFLMLQHGQAEAADRVLNYCLSNYPKCGAAHNLRAQQMSADGRAEEAADYLLSMVDQFSEKEQIGTLITVVRIYLVSGEIDRALGLLVQLRSKNVTDSFDQIQIKLYGACCAVVDGVTSVKSEEVHLNEHHEKIRIHILIPSDDPVQFDLQCAQISVNCWKAPAWTLTFERCSEASRTSAYRTGLEDTSISVLILAQKNIEIHNPAFLSDIVHAVRECDVVGFAGAQRWTRLDWRHDDFTVKAGSLIVGSNELSGLCEMHVLGPARTTHVPDVAILDGSLLAINREKMTDMVFDDELLGAENLLEEYALYCAAQLKRRLMIHQNLGIFINPKIPVNTKYIASARAIVCERLKFNPFDIVTDGDLRLQLPVAMPHDAVQIMTKFLSS